jgi:hypothetical protein
MTPILSVLLLPVVQLAAADPSGRWEGVLRIPGEPSALVLTLERTAGEWSAALDVPARRVEGLAADVVVVRGDTVFVELGRQFRLRAVVAPDGGGMAGEAEIQGGVATVALGRAGSAEAAALAEELAAYVPPAPSPDPMAARIVTEDIDRFWRAWDAATPETLADVLQREYVDRATPGLEDFIFRRVHGADELAETVQRFPLFYAHARKSMHRVHDFEPEIRRAFVRMKELYPDAVFPDVYFTVGRLTSGGTVSPRGLLIGTELYTRTSEMPESEFEEWMLELFSPIETIPALVAHELIHYQQQVGGPGTLLKQALVEGVADYLGALISGGHINERRHGYGDANEARLWCEFQEQMHGDDLSAWFYNMATARDRPSDLGYWMGYKIADAWAARVSDEQERVQGLLHIPDPQTFLAESGYADRFDCDAAA